MKFFKPWTWFQSEERKLQLEALKLQIQYFSMMLERERANPLPPTEEIKLVVEEKETYAKPYQSIRYINGTVVVVMHDGSTLTKQNVSRTFYQNVCNCSSIEEVQDLMFDVPVEVETQEEREMVQDNLAILRVNKDFTVTDDGVVYLKKVNLPMPASVTGTFIEILEKMALGDKEMEEPYEALKMFWYWTALNPVESSRRDLLNFVKNKDIKITKNGLLEMYRRIVSVNKDEKVTDKTKIDFISNSYTKVKFWKKNPTKFKICEENGSYSLIKEEKPDVGTLVGNLYDLYKNLSVQEENRYTDNHTHTKDIRIGAVYKEDEDKIDLNNREDCSNGLHVGSHEFGFSGFGDTGVLALVNPSKVRSVPVSDTNKMRVSEMFIAATMDLDDYKKHVTSPAKTVVDYSQEYFNTSVEELEELVSADKGKKAIISCQKNESPLSAADIQEISSKLKAKVVEF